MKANRKELEDKFGTKPTKETLEGFRDAIEEWIAEIEEQEVEERQADDEYAFSMRD